MTFTFVAFGAAFVLVLWAGQLLPTTLARISRVLHIPQFVIAFLLVSFATSIPEIFIGIFSAVQGVPNLSLGNIMGANLVNLTLVVGLSVIVGGVVRGDGKISSQNFWLAFFIAMLPVVLAFDGALSRIDGIILLAAFVLYISKIFKDKQYFHKAVTHEGEPPGFHSFSNALKAFSWFLVGTAVLLLGSFALIASAKEIVRFYFDADFLLFGVLFMALGTALPELVFGIRSTLKGQARAMLGNALGTIPFNAAAVIGIVSLIQPMDIDFTNELLVVSLFLFSAFLLFHLFVYTRDRINRKEGFVLLLLYVAFVVLSFL